MSKKLFSVILTAVLAVSILLCFAACGGSGDPTEGSDTTLSTEQGEELMASVQDETGAEEEAFENTEASETSVQEVAE